VTVASALAGFLVQGLVISVAAGVPLWEGLTDAFGEAFTLGLLLPSEPSTLAGTVFSAFAVLVVQWAPIVFSYMYLRVARVTRVPRMVKTLGVAVLLLFSGATVVAAAALCLGI
jgi:hypothetical protein